VPHKTNNSCPHCAAPLRLDGQCVQAKCRDTNKTERSSRIHTAESIAPKTDANADDGENSPYAIVRKLGSIPKLRIPSIPERKPHARRGRDPVLIRTSYSIVHPDTVRNRDPKKR